MDNSRTIRNNPCVNIKGCHSAKQRVNALYAAEQFIEQRKLNTNGNGSSQFIVYGKLKYHCSITKSGNVVVGVASRGK